MNLWLAPRARTRKLIVPTDKHCLGCSAQLGAAFLDLGRTPLANSYLTPEQAAAGREESFPLAVAYCGGCHLVQLTHQVEPDKLFSRYLYFSSFSDSFLEHSRKMAASYIARFGLGPGKRVLEIASNDGYLLQNFKPCGASVLGVEPARNIAAEAVARGIPTLAVFFGPDTVAEIRAQFGMADLIVGNNVLAHVPRINDFLAAVTACLDSNGAAVFEFPYLKHLLDRTEFDTIYHEHVFYYSLTALDGLARRAGLEIFDVLHQPIHGGSLRLFLQPPGVRPVDAAVREMLKAEAAAGLTGADRYARFAGAVESLRNKLRALLGKLKADGKRIAAYGAPAKGNTLLNYCGIGRETLDFTVDRSPHKQGLLLPGSRIPIRAPEALLQERPDYALILPWNIADEIIGQQQAYVAAGGRFIVPVPEPAIVNPA